MFEDRVIAIMRALENHSMHNYRFENADLFILIVIIQLILARTLGVLICRLMLLWSFYWVYFVLFGCVISCLLYRECRHLT